MTEPQAVTTDNATDSRKEVKLPPPVWNPETKSYGDFRFQVTLWEKACEKSKVSKADRGYKLYDKLKDITCKSVGDKIVTAARVGDIDLFSDDSVENILKLLDKTFKKDDLTMLHNSWSSFIRLKRKKDEKMDEYITRYESKVTELKRELKNDNLPEKVYGMQLIDSARLSDKDRQLVLTGIDYEKEDEMLQQTITALRKFFTGQLVHNVEGIKMVSR